LWLLRIIVPQQINGPLHKMQLRKKLRWVVKSPSSYNDYLFNEIELSEKYDLIVSYEEDSLSIYPWKEKVVNVYKKDGKNKFLRKFHLLISAFFERETFFIVGGWGSLFLLSLIFILNIRSRKYAIWLDSQNLNQKRSIAKERIRKLLLSIIYKRTPLFLATGRMAIKNLVSDGCSKSKIINFPYVVDSTKYNRNISFELHDPIVFLSAGRLQLDLKGYDLTIKALSILKKRANLKFKYLIAGDGPDRGELIKLINQLHLENEVKLVGWLEQSEIVDFYKQGDVFLHPAIFEPYGTVIQEAISSGLLIIGSDQTGAIVDLITSGKNGYIHKTNDINDIIKHISIFLKSHTNKRGLLAESYIIADNFDAKFSIDKLEKYTR